LYHKSVTSFQDHIPAKFHEYTPIGSLVTDKNQRGCFFMKHGVLVGLCMRAQHGQPLRIGLHSVGAFYSSGSYHRGRRSSSLLAYTRAMASFSEIQCNE